ESVLCSIAHLQRGLPDREEVVFRISHEGNIHGARPPQRNARISKNSGRDPEANRSWSTQAGRLGQLRARVGQDSRRKPDDGTPCPGSSWKRRPGGAAPWSWHFCCPSQDPLQQADEFHRANGESRPVSLLPNLVQ